MRTMTFTFDYALIDPMTLMYKVDHAFRNIVFSTYEDIDEDSFLLHFFPFNGEIPYEKIQEISDFVNPYLFES